MPEHELMYFFIAGTRESADVIRTFADNRPIHMLRPSSTLYEKALTVRVGDTDEWEAANEELRQAAKHLGIKVLNNLYPPDDMAEAARRGAELRMRRAGV